MSEVTSTDTLGNTVPPGILLKASLIYARKALDAGIPETDLCFAIEDVCNDYADAVHSELERANDDQFVHNNLEGTA